MTYANPDALVTTAWLTENLNDPGIRVVDGTSFLPNVPRDAREEFEAKHIPGAVLLDIEEVSDHRSPLPHMLPSAEAFGEQVGALGIGNEHRVIVYDSMGVRTSPRVWWMFKVFGHVAVAVLDGGLPQWEADGGPLDSGAASPAATAFTAEFRPGLVRDLDRMMANQTSRAEQVIDARPADRFAGTAPEPRPGIPSGHMPGSKSMPVEMVVDSATGRVLPADTLRVNFDALGLDLAQPAVTTCGSGVAACTVSLGFHLLGHPIAPVYDGSWSEWGARDDTPKESD